jgi:hypothetical protein
MVSMTAVFIDTTNRTIYFAIDISALSLWAETSGLNTEGMVNLKRLLQRPSGGHIVSGSR